MAQKHNVSCIEHPMTVATTEQGPQKRYRRLRFPSFNSDVWSEKNPLLQKGELGHEKNTGRFKVGDGVTYWEDLPYNSVGDKGEKGDNATINGYNTINIVEGTNISVEQEGDTLIISAKGEASGSYNKEEIDNKFAVVNSSIDANADAIQKTRDDYIEADSEIHQILNSHAGELTTLKNNQDDLGDQVSVIESKIPESASETNSLVTKQQLLDEEMDIRDDYNELVSELQTQITAQAGAIAKKVDATGDTMTGALNVPELNVATSEGTLNLSITAGVATIATNNGLDIVSQTKFDKAPTTDDNTTWANALDASLVRKAQVATAITDSLAQGLAQKQDIATAINYDNITNCITEIPQDIKLELNNGTLTLKAGSKVYVPNGAGKFDILVTEKDISSSYSTTGTSQNMLLLISDGSSYDTLSPTAVSSGSTDSLAGTPYHAWYDTTNNLVKLYLEDGVTVKRHLSLPFAITHGHNNGGSDIGVDSIDQVFNGYGYIGSTAFALPGVKGLVPNGRNEDGTLKNIEFATSMVLTATDTSTSTNVLTLNNSNISRITATNYFYDEQKNIIINKYNNAQMLVALYGFNKTDNGVISEFATKTAFHAVDYSDLQPTTNSGLLSNILSAIYPIGSVYITTANTNPMATLIKGSSWTLVAKGRALWGGNGTSGSGTTANDQYNNAPANTTIASGLPNITGSISTYIRSNSNTKSGAFSNNKYAASSAWGGGNASSFIDLNFDASKSNSIYGRTVTVQPPAYVVNVWRRES